jgi:ribonuclease Z
LAQLKFFGTSSADPSLKRGFACIGLIDENDITILDCGDGSISKLIQNGIDVNSISNIFVTHYHSDHLSGLTQVIETMAIHRRTSRLQICGPAGLLEYFSQIEKTTKVAFNRKFEIEIREVEPHHNVKREQYQVIPFAMQHTIPCLGYRIEGWNITLAYSGDTEPCEESLQLAKNVDLLIHEATYLENDKDRARHAKHSTPREAAETARDAHARKLVLTHVSDRFESEEEMLDETRDVHPNVSVAFDGREIDLLRLKN